MTASLREQCHTFLSGNREAQPAELFAAMAKWCEQHDVMHDIYGEGATIQAFEQKIAQLLGFESALFVISGTMTQPTALQLVCQQRRCFNVAMHETCHIMNHEAQGYQQQRRFHVLPVGNPYRPWLLEDLKAWPDEIAAAVYELPMRELGGQLPTWDNLEAIKSYCHAQNIHLYMDGARLWESAAYYECSYAQIAQGFSSVYVSLYKGINGLGGSILLGDAGFIEKARLWMRRQGGNVYHRTPYIVSAAMQFDERIARMGELFARTQQVYQIFRNYPDFTLNPHEPQANMFHWYLPISYEKALVLRDNLAKTKGIWLGHPQTAPQPEQCFIECYVGDRLLAMADHDLIDILEWVNHHVRE
ncbi:threonine aldolase family protein [Celerinatantimonas diazotrophica]|uniref:L-threonine aldolase n=1 Tax=Celerinatantimonas diazotrophica TaxID=412034 RepID=A0A4V2PNE2_9GAMM|nr:beta-eliminating lyase-related protein [Celerinatantimonas diazotrophica]TCK46731.1 L-threonine aldolase [Celerinatantimonas diazotrophica]CAG9295433.1 L-allo-threonine aldolase [Celerinatantimonas diazotrophica]